MGDTQWEELDGEPHSVAEKGRKYQEIAAAIERSMTSLTNIENEMGSTSLALDKTRKLAGEVRDSIEKAKVRYRDTGEALETYGNALRPAKYDQADPAATQLRTLRADLEDAEAAERTAQSNADELPGNATPAEKAEADQAATNAGNSVGSIRQQITQYESQWQDGKDAKDRAARTAIEKIEEVVSGSKTNGLEDGFWDKVGDVLSKISKVLKVICDIAGILAIFLSWVPILGQVLLVLAAVGAILAVINSVVAAIKGDGSWWAVLGATAMAALTLFGGKAVTALAKYAKARSVVNTAATLGANGARARFGTTVLRESENLVVLSKGERMMNLLKSPFVRSADDAARMSAFQANRSFSGFMTQLGSASKAAFPNPFKDWGLRAITGNADLVDLAKFAKEGDVVLDGASRVAGSLAVLGGGALHINNIATQGNALANAANGTATATSANSLLGSTNNAPWSKITGGAITYGSPLFN
jgi:archaellum component FlaC